MEDRGLLLVDGRPWALLLERPDEGGAAPRWWAGDRFVARVRRIDRGLGMAFLSAGGMVIERDLQSGELLHADPGCIVGLQPSVGCELSDVSGLSSAVLSGAELVIAQLKGPGRIWLQSSPMTRLAGRARSF